MAVTKRTRYEVLRRDNHTCRYCGATAPDATLTVDHVVPVSLGGTDKPDNLVAACRDCNAGKAASNPDAPLVETVADDALRWAAAMKLAMDRRRLRVDKLRSYCLEFTDELNEYGIGLADEDGFLPHDWADTVEQFYRAGLPIEDLKYALATAMSKRHVPWRKTFRYMCGICWNILRELQEEASRIIAEDG